MDPKERTRNMMDEMRRKVIEHEKRSKSGEGRLPSNPRLSIMVAGPLFLAAVLLYSFTIYNARQYKKIIKQEREALDQAINDSVRTQTRSINADINQFRDSEILLDSDVTWR